MHCAQSTCSSAAAPAFLLPQGLNNKFWYKTQFQTTGADSSVDVASFGGSVTHRFAATLAGLETALPILGLAHSHASAAANNVAGYYRPWLRLAESRLSDFRGMSSVTLPILRSTAFGGDLSVVGQANLLPSPLGELELLASGSLPGLGQLLSLREVCPSQRRHGPRHVSIFPMPMRGFSLDRVLPAVSSSRPARKILP